MAEGRKLRVVHKIVGVQPPLTQKWSDERGDETTDIYEHIKNLEAGITLRLGLGKCLGAFLCRFCLKVVVHLSDDSLKVTFEETVAKRNEKQRKAGQRKKPGYVAGSGKHRNG